MSTPPSVQIPDTPREKLMHSGPQALSDVELLAVLLGSGTQQSDVFNLAEKALKVVDSRNHELRYSHLQEVVGFGTAKSCLIVAALEFARRRIRPEGVRIRRASDVLPLVSHLADRRQEHFICISLNGAHEVIATRILTVGLANTAHVHPREVFSDPITDRACAVIAAHNHPSGDCTPSTEDIMVTTRLRHAGETLGIPLLDHIVFSRRGFYSFRESGTLSGN